MKKVLFMALAMLVAFAACKKENPTPTPTPTPTTIAVDQLGFNPIVEINDTIEICANVTCSSTIGSVKLCYKLEGSADSTVIDMTNGTYTFFGSTYNYGTTLIAPSEPTMIDLYVIAAASDGTTTRSILENIVVSAPFEVVINEISGVSKYIELYNPADYAMDLTDCVLVKNDESPYIWTAPEGLTIQAKDYILLYSSKSTVIPEGYDETLIFQGGISPKKSLKIELLQGDPAISADVFTRGPEPWDSSISEVDKAFARIPDGGDWKLAEETPGTANPETGEDIPQE